MAGSAWNNQLVPLVIISASAGSFNGLFVYSPAPGPGNLILSIAATAGTDPFGNAFPGGLTVGQESGTQVNIFENGGNGNISFPLNNSNFIINPFIQGILQSNYAALQLQSPEANVVGHGDVVLLGLNSANTAGTSFANMDFVYGDINDVQHEYAYMDATGFNITTCGGLFATQPGSGTSASNPATQEEWHTLPLASGWTSVNGPYYRFLPDQTVQIIGAATHAAFTGTTQLSTSGGLPAGYRPINTWNIGSAGIPGRAGCEVGPAGTVSAVPNGVSCTECDPAGVFPLNL